MKTIEIPTDDPLKMIRAIRDKHYEETKHMTLEERDEYIQEKADAFYRRMEQTPLPDESVFPFLHGEKNKSLLKGDEIKCFCRKADD